MQFDWNTVFAVLTPVLLVLLTGVGWFYKHERERREAAEHQVSEHKYRTYIHLLDIFFDTMKATKAGKNMSEKELHDSMFDVNKDIILYGSDDVVRIYQKWLEDAQKGAGGIAGVERFGELVVAIRRDMGYPKTKISSDEVLRQFITDYDEVKAKGQLLGKHP